MSEIFPRLSSILNSSTSVTASPAIHSIEAIKSELLAKLLTLPTRTALKAEVIAKMSDGTYVANVEDIPLRLSLPQSIKVGDKIHLSLMQTHPRPIFELDGKTTISLVESALPRVTGPANKSSTPKNELEEHANPHLDLTQQSEPPKLSKAELDAVQVSTLSTQKFTAKFQEATNAYSSQQSNITSAEIELSETARIIGTVLRDTEKTHAELSIRSPVPLVDDLTAAANPRSLSARISTQLHRQIEYSGLFYESHLTQWATGARSLEAINQEPQAQLSIRDESSILTDQNNEQHLQLSALVHQQLDVAENASFKWQGHLSQNISMSMQIQKEYRDSGKLAKSLPTEKNEEIYEHNNKLKLSQKNVPTPSEYQKHDSHLMDSEYAISADKNEPRYPLQPENVALERGQESQAMSESVNVNVLGRIEPSHPKLLELSETTEDHSSSEANNKDDIDQATHAIWNTQLALDFPNLGRIRIDLTLQDNISDIRCSVDSQGVLQILHQHSKQLLEGLHEKGQKLRSMKVMSK